MDKSHHNHHHEHQDDHDHHQDHDHSHEGDHGHHSNPIVHWFQHLLSPHSHGHLTAALDAAFSTERGIWALKISFGGLMITALLQVFIVLVTNSVALLADTIHNFSDALTAIPLGLAFILALQARNHLPRTTGNGGYHRTR